MTDTLFHSHVWFDEDRDAWIHERGSADVEFSSEEAACQDQRLYREENGRDPHTGKPVA